MATNSSMDIKQFTDCMYFLNGYCRLEGKCLFRHCKAALAQLNKCHKWPKICRNAQCPYRHPGPPARPKPTTTATPVPNPMSAGTSTVPSAVPKAAVPADVSISFFWDIENVPIPRGQKPFDIVQRIREKLVVGTNLREISFSCFCNSPTIPQENQLSLHHANVRIVHVPDRKPGAVDRQIMLELDRFERAHRPPATIVLISGDIDFVGKLSDLRHQAGFHVMVIHNKPAKSELKSTVNAHFPWEAFTLPSMANAGATGTEAATTNTTIPRRAPSANFRRPDSSSRPTVKSTQKCPLCPSEFDSIPPLRQHQEAKKHIFECPGCDENFFTADGLVQHQKAKEHHAIRFPCAKCGLAFSTVQSLNQHQQATGHLDSNRLRTETSRNDFVFVNPPSRPVPPHVTTTAPSREEVILRGISALATSLPKIFK